MDQVTNIISSPLELLTEIGIYESVTAKLAMTITYIIVALVVTKILDKVIIQGFKIQNKSKKGNEKRSKTLISLVQNAVKYIMWFIVVTTILSKFGISVEEVIASAGVVGLAIGFGAQTIVKDVTAGLLIMSENQFDVGNYTKANNGGTTVAEGTAKPIELRPTRINTISGKFTILPNSSMGEITNYLTTNGTAIAKVPVSVGENTDNVEKKLNKLFTSLRSEYYLFVSDPVVIGIDAFEDARVILRVSAEIIPGEGFSSTRIVRREVQKTLLQEGIKTPQPIMTPFNHSENGV